MLVAWNMKYLTTLALILFIGDSLQYVRDESFLRFCDNVGGKAVRSEVNGDTCEVVWNFPAADKEEAEDYCKTWGAYPVQHSDRTNDGQPLCIYVNVYECRPDYTLIKGHCYRMVKKDMNTYDEADQACKGHKINGVEAQIFKHFDVDQLRFIRAYFADLRGFWVQAEMDPETQKKKVNQAVVFGMAGLYKGAAPGDTIKLHDNGRAQVMCYYQAPETPLSFAAKARLLGEHYWPTVLDGYNVVWRTGGYYSAMISNVKTEAYEQCEKSMRAIVGPGVGTVWDATKENVLRLTPDIKQSFIQSYLPFFICYWSTSHYNNGWYTRYHHKHYRVPKSGQSGSCESQSEVSASAYGATWYEPDYSITWSVSLFSEPTEGYNVRERTIAYYAPILCTMDFKQFVRPTKCADGWTAFTRGYGRVVCHKLFDAAKNFDQAQEACKADQARLSTFTSEAEFEVLKTLGGQAITSRWLGFRKRQGCPLITNGKCSALSIVEFVDDEFAEDTPQVREIIAKMWRMNEDGTYAEPNNNLRDEMCVELRDTMMLNDLACTNTNSFACMKNADA